MKFCQMAFGSLFLILVFSFSCGDKSTYPADEHTNTFPLKIGNSWVYDEKVITYAFNIPSLADTIQLVRHRRVMSLDTIYNSIQTFTVDDTIIYQDRPDIQRERHWYALDDTSLLEYGSGLTQPGTDTFAVNIHQNPYLLLRFALLEGKTWTYPLSPWTVEKTVSGYEELECKGNPIKCDKVTTTYVANENRQQLLTEWYSNIGLIRSIYGPIRQNYHDSTGAYDSLHTYYVIDLTDYHIIH
jgi:hypothetical protein